VGTKILFATGEEVKLGLDKLNGVANRISTRLSTQNGKLMGKKLGN